MSFSAALTGIDKSFGDVRANKDLRLHVQAKTIHALLGENGAGKSTAMKILFGMLSPDTGEIRIGDNVVEHWNPTKAFKIGMGMVHQHFMLAGPETVLDNLALGQERTRFGVIRDRTKERRELTDLMTSTGLHVPLDAPVENLPVSLQSRCEILKVLYRKASFLILDEPTAVLSPPEIQDFLKTLKRLREQGCTILVVTHKLKEVLEVADEVTVLRAGATVGTRKIANASVDDLTELMVGKRLQMPKVGAKDNTAAPLITLNDGTPLRPGQITGIGGVEGNGQEALAAQVIELCEKRNIPLATIPADRQRDGLVMGFTLLENLRLKKSTVRQHAWSQRFVPATVAENQVLRKFDVRPPILDLPARALSGGNQQKLIAARELGALSPSSIVLAINPTRGVDVGAIAFMHAKLIEAAENGCSVLLISTELDELMELSHRLGVLFRGQIKKWFDGPPYDEKSIGVVMVGS